MKGWVVTEQGLKQGAIQSEGSRSGVPYVRWPETITQSSLLLTSINDITGSNPPLLISPNDTNTVSTAMEFKEKFEAKHMATDGHYVRSKAEVMIDNWLYIAEIVHAYERNLPIEENVYCDFYIRTDKSISSIGKIKRHFS